MLDIMPYRGRKVSYTSKFKLSRRCLFLVTDQEYVGLVAYILTTNRLKDVGEIPLSAPEIVIGWAAW